MIDNRKSYFEKNGQARPEALMENPWLRYLVGADQPYWNAERIGSMAEKAENAALDYTLRTLASARLSAGHSQSGLCTHLLLMS